MLMEGPLFVPHQAVSEYWRATFARYLGLQLVEDLCKWVSLWTYFKTARV